MRGKSNVVVEALALKVAQLEAENDRLQEKYADLLYQVQNKIPGETRHETAKRIINQHERPSSGPSAALEAENAELKCDLDAADLANRDLKEILGSKIS